jgi:hypothetical protein
MANQTGYSSTDLLHWTNNGVMLKANSGTNRMDVVDAHGKLLAVLVDGFKPAGNYKAVLPGTFGRGMYIIRLTADAKKLATLHVKL